MKNADTVHNAPGVEERSTLYKTPPIFHFFTKTTPHFPLLQNTSIFRILNIFKHFLQPPQFHFLPTGLRSEYFV